MTLMLHHGFRMSLSRLSVLLPRRGRSLAFCCAIHCSSLNRAVPTTMPSVMQTAMPHWLDAEEKPSSYAIGGYRPTSLGEMLGERYKILKKIGRGEYSTVWLAEDTHDEDRTCVAIKILTSAATVSPKVHELEFLQRLRDGDPAHIGADHVPRLQDNFTSESRFGPHLCLVTDLMGVHIYKFMDCLLLKPRRYPEEVARMVIRDVLRALDYAHTECGIIHTDIKLSNVLAACYGRMTVDLAMASDEEEDLHSQDCIAADGSTVTIHETAPVLIMPQQPEDWNQMLFKLVDFGVGCFVDKVDQHFSQTICTIPARPPEVAIGAKWDTSVDIWGVGALLFQMLSHCILYPEDVTEGILPIFQWRIFGDFPPELVARSSKGIAWFDENGHLLDGLVEALQNEGHLKLRISLKEYLEAVTDGEVTFSDECWDILEKMLTVDPRQRPTAKELLSHPWLSGELPKAYYFTG